MVQGYGQTQFHSPTPTSAAALARPAAAAALARPVSMLRPVCPRSGPARVHRLVAARPAGLCVLGAVFLTILLALLAFLARARVRLTRPSRNRGAPPVRRGWYLI